MQKYLYFTIFAFILFSSSNIFIKAQDPILTLDWIPDVICSDIDNPCNFTIPQFWFNNTAPLPGLTRYNININLNASDPIQYIQISVGYNQEQFVNVNLAGSVYLNIYNQAGSTEFNSTTLANSTLTINSHFVSEQITVSNGSVTVNAGTTELNGVTQFDALSTFIVNNQATLILDGQTDLYCQLQMIEQSTLNMVYNHYPVVFHAGLYSDFKVLLQQSISLDGVSNLTYVDGHNGGELILLPGSEVTVSGELYISTISQYPGSDLTVNTETATIVLSLTLSDTTSTATFNVSKNLNIADIESRGILTFITPNASITGNAQIADFILSGDNIVPIVQFESNATITALTTDTKSFIIVNQSTTAITQKSAQTTAIQLYITVNPSGSLIMQTLNTYADINILGQANFQKKVTAGTLNIRHGSVVNFNSDQLLANLNIYGGQIIYNQGTTLWQIGGSLNILGGMFAPTSDVIVSDSLTIAGATLKLLKVRLQVLSQMVLDSDSIVVLQQNFQPATTGSTPIEVEGPIQMDGVVNILFLDDSKIDYSQNYNLLSSQDAITGNFYAVYALQAEKKYKCEVTTGKPPNYVYLTFPTSESGGGGGMASWKIGLIVVSIMVFMVVAGFGFLYYKRNSGYIRLNN